MPPPGERRAEVDRPEEEDLQPPAELRPQAAAACKETQSDLGTGDSRCLDHLAILWLVVYYLTGQWLVTWRVIRFPRKPLLLGISPSASVHDRGAGGAVPLALIATRKDELHGCSYPHLHPQGVDYRRRQVRVRSQLPYG
jgi:hypothetical protein